MSNDKQNQGGRRKGARATVRDIAKLAGVSVATVSRAMRHDGVVSERTRAKVLEAASALDYRENVLARDLATRKSDIVAVVVGDITNPFYPDVVDRLTKRITLLGLHTMLVNMTEGVDVEDTLSPLFKYQVKAAVFVAVTLTSRALDVCRQYSVPVFLLNRYVDSKGVTAIACDNFRAGEMVAGVLLRAGHENMVYIAGKSDTSTNRDRMAGFTTALHAQGRECLVEPAGEYSYEAGHRAGLRLIGSGKAFDAIFCANDIVAMGVLDAIRYAGGLRVPDDVSVIGFDDIPSAAWPSYDLTTVRQPVDQMIEVLASRVGRLDAQEVQRDSRQDQVILIPGELVARSSARLSEMYTAESTGHEGDSRDAS